MSDIQASPNPIVVDNTISPPEADGMTRIKYDKQAAEELWERKPGMGWTLVPTYDEGDISGRYDVILRPGQSYAAGVFSPTFGPNSKDPRGTTVTVFAVLKKPSARPLITDHSGTGGGTWLRHGVKTTVPTTLFIAGASRTRPNRDSSELPTLIDPDAVSPNPLGSSVSHDIELKPLVPGHHYFVTLMVVDDVGNWEVLDVEQDSLRRKMTVEFSTIHIQNDGDRDFFDAQNVGEAEFWFRVSAGDEGRAHNTLKEFHLPEMDIDDADFLGQPYSVGFAYVELEPQSIPPGRTQVWVNSTAIEDDSPFGEEGAGFIEGRRLDLPIGPGEKVPSKVYQLHCPTSTGDDFWYNVDVTYSVDYVP
jgi:hypothetical protein